MLFRSCGKYKKTSNTISYCEEGFCSRYCRDKFYTKCGICIKCNKEYRYNTSKDIKNNDTMCEKCRKKERRSSTEKYNFMVFKRDGFKCMYCGKSPIDNGVKLQMDHIIPLNKGGENILDNFITSCLECNHSKTDNFIYEEYEELLEKIRIKNLSMNK